MESDFETRCSMSKSFCNVSDNIFLHNLSKETEKDKKGYSGLSWKIFLLSTNESSVSHWCMFLWESPFLKTGLAAEISPWLRECKSSVVEWLLRPAKENLFSLFRGCLGWSSGGMRLSLILLSSWPVWSLLGAMPCFYWHHNNLDECLCGWLGEHKQIEEC